MESNAYEALELALALRLALFELSYAGQQLTPSRQFILTPFGAQWRRLESEVPIHAPAVAALFRDAGITPDFHSYP